MIPVSRGDLEKAVRRVTPARTRPPYEVAAAERFAYAEGTL